MLEIIKKLKHGVYQENILSFLFLLVAQSFFILACGEFSGYFGIAILSASFVLSFITVHKLKKYIDINLIKIFQPFIIALFTVQISYEKSVGGITFVLCWVYFVISHLVFFNSLALEKRASFGEMLMSSCIIFFAASLFVICLSEMLGSYEYGLEASFFFKIYYLLVIINTFLMGNYEVGLPFGAQEYKKRYLLSKLMIAIFVICKLSLIFGFGQHTMTGLLYVVITMLLILAHRHKKEYFVFANLAIVLVSFLPGQFSEIYFDPVMVSAVVCLFYLKSPVLLKRSSKFGELVVSYRYRTRMKILYHNNIVHGVEPIDYNGGECSQQTITGTYRRGALLSVLDAFKNEGERIAVLGMGVGMISSLVKKGQELTFYEIDPNMQYIAVNSGLFNYIKKSPAEVKIKIGHARKSLEQESKSYDLIIVDTYQGRKVVSEFMTLEAFEMYFSKLSDRGVVAIHLTSGSKDNESIVASICKKLGLYGLICYRSSDDKEYAESMTGVLKAQKKDVSGEYSDWIKNVVGFYDSFKKNPQQLARDSYVVWAAIARNKKDLSHLVHDSRWHELRFNSEVTAPTDKDAKFGEGSILTKEIE